MYFRRINVLMYFPRFDLVVSTCVRRTHLVDDRRTLNGGGTTTGDDVKLRRLHLDSVSMN